jgi:hypothetical protein
MTEKAVEVRAIEIPGMQIKFTAPFSPDGDGIEFVVAVDSTIDRADLDELLDRIRSAHDRQAAIKELPLLRQNLHGNRNLLRMARREKAAHEAGMSARYAQLRAGGHGRGRSEVQANPQDVNALSQHDQRIIKIEEEIKRAEARVPYLEAIVAGKEPPDPFAAANDTQMAAE